MTNGFNWNDIEDQALRNEAKQQALRALRAFVQGDQEALVFALRGADPDLLLYGMLDNLAFFATQQSVTLQMSVDQMIDMLMESLDSSEE